MLTQDLAPVQHQRVEPHFVHRDLIVRDEYCRRVVEAGIETRIIFGTDIVVISTMARGRSSIYGHGYTRTIIHGVTAIIPAIPTPIMMIQVITTTDLTVMTKGSRGIMQWVMFNQPSPKKVIIRVR